MRRIEKKLQMKIYDILRDVIKEYSFHGVRFNGIEVEWEINRRKADIALLDEEDNPFLIIETKRKIEVPGVYRVVASYSMWEIMGRGSTYLGGVL